MKKLTLLLFLITFYCQAQITFEKGYIITNDGVKTSCLIKNLEWLNNPENIKYKLSENGNEIDASTEEISEFGVGEFKFVKYSGSVDRSPVITELLDSKRAPQFEEEVVFLKELIRGNINLYSLVDGNLVLFFFNNEQREIEPLIYKRYYKEQLAIATNDGYKQQLTGILNCNAAISSGISRLAYNEKALRNLFEKQNNCISGEAKVVEKTKKGEFRFFIRPGASINTFRIPKRFPGLSLNPNPNEYDFSNVVGYQIGFELEYVLPFNKNKWSVSIEPSYNFIKSESTTTNTIPELATLTYKAFELPLSLRHYFFLSKKSKIFINASYVLIFDLNSSLLPFSRGSGFRKGSNRSFGLGYDYNNKIRLEARYDTDRGALFPTSNLVSTKFTSYGIVLGYGF